MEVVLQCIYAILKRTLQVGLPKGHHTSRGGTRRTTRSSRLPVQSILQRCLFRVFEGAQRLTKRILAFGVAHLCGSPSCSGALAGDRLAEAVVLEAT